MDGREAVRQLRGEGYKNPIIMLTGHDSDADTIDGLDAGANDYVDPSRSGFRFCWRVCAFICASMRRATTPCFAFGPFTFQPGSKHLISEKGSKLRLTEKETAILRFLYRARQSVVTRDVLLKEVWGYNANVTTHTLETHIYRLAAEDRAGSGEIAAFDYRGRRLQAYALTGVEHGSRRPISTTSRATRSLRCSSPKPCASLRFPRGNAFCAAVRFCFPAMSPRTAAISYARVASSSRWAIGSREERSHPATGPDRRDGIDRPPHAARRPPSPREPSGVLQISRTLFQRALSESPRSARRLQQFLEKNGCKASRRS